MDTVSPETYSITDQTTSSSTPSTPTTLPPHINASNLPLGLPFLGPLTGYTTGYRTSQIHARLTYLSTTISRPLTPNEQSAIAGHTAKGLAIASYGPSLGLAVGAWRIYNTRHEYRWPFYGKILSEEQGKGFWDGNKMRLNGKEILAGVSREAKSAALHLGRGAAYLMLTLFAIPLGVSAYAGTVAAVGEVRDQRLQDMTTELRKVSEGRIRERKRKSGEIVGPPRSEDKGRKGRRDPTGQGDQEVGELWRGHREGIQRVEGGVDEDSPTGRMGTDAVFDFGEEEEREKTMLSGGARGAGAFQAAGNSGKDKVDKPYQRQTQEYSYDDASPTGGIGARGMDDGQSAWQRIRQGAAAQGSSSGSEQTRRVLGPRSSPEPRPQREQQGQSNDDFSISSAEQEKGYAKSEAQREFDERVEKERRGGDFSDTGGGKRW